MVFRQKTVVKVVCSWLCEQIFFFPSNIYVQTVLWSASCKLFPKKKLVLYGSYLVSVYNFLVCTPFKISYYDPLLNVFCNLEIHHFAVSMFLFLSYVRFRFLFNKINTFARIKVTGSAVQKTDLKIGSHQFNKCTTGTSLVV